MPELVYGELVDVSIGNAHVRDLRPCVGDFERQIGRYFALDSEIPLLRVAGSQLAVNREYSLAETGIIRERDGDEARAVCEHESRDDVIECPLGQRLDEGELRNCKRRRNPRLLNPDQTVAGSHHGLPAGPVG